MTKRESRPVREDEQDEQDEQGLGAEAEVS